MRKIYLQKKTNHQLLYEFIDGTLENIKFQTASDLRIGDIASGVVHQVDQRLKACFVDIGQSELAYLPFDKIYNNQVHRGERLIFQVERLATNSKKLSLTTFVKVSDQYLVYSPFESSINISKKLSDEVQEQIRQRLSEIITREGIIVRTKAVNLTNSELHQSLEHLRQKWHTIKQSKQSKGIIYRSKDQFNQFIQFTPHNQIDEIIVDDQQVSQKLKIDNPELADQIYYDRQFYVHKPYHLTTIADKLTGRKVKMKNGAYLTIDRTEALTAIDVDFGSYLSHSGKNAPYMDINSQAAKECAKQLRLRNISGAIVIDFLNMKSKREQQQVSNIFREEANQDGVEVYIVGFTRLGMLEVTRKRMDENIYQFLGIDERTLIEDDEFKLKHLEEDLLAYDSNPDIECVHIEMTSGRLFNWKLKLNQLNELHRFEFECYISQNDTLHEPYKLYKIGDVDWLLSRAKEREINVDKLF
ncbi:ribonuclease E/G [Alkalibacillus silvisoli]|uniref:Rne/Rng family ribonuclease n=1 Tax=Alkalibacillus silvisoli TaxID=392823 RepID=A0ABN0ZRX9_9BACI